MNWHFFLLLLLLSPVCGQAATLALSGPLEPGTAVFLEVVDFPPGARLTGKLKGRSFPLTANGKALIALDMAAKPGPVTLRVTIKPAKEKKELLTRTFQVPARKYKEEHINNLPKKKVDLNPKDLKRAKKETRSIVATYKQRGGKPGYEAGFRQPVLGRISGVFGSRRVLNGKPRRAHNGTDIAAPKGTSVIAASPGRVSLAGKGYFFTGNTVVLDHGDGVVTLYAHMDSLLVQKDDQVTADTVIGTVGMTGRATGPHLHWGARVRGARVDPLRLPGINPDPAPDPSP